MADFEVKITQGSPDGINVKVELLANFDTWDELKDMWPLIDEFSKVDRIKSNEIPADEILKYVG